MSLDPKLSHTAAMILQAIHAGYVYGFGIMEVTGLPSGTVYPALRRLERDVLIRSHWERQSIADAGQRPPRKYYKTHPLRQSSAGGFAQTLSASRQADSIARGGKGMSIRRRYLAIIRGAALLVPRPATRGVARRVAIGTLVRLRSRAAKHARSGSAWVRSPTRSGSAETVRARRRAKCFASSLRYSAFVPGRSGGSELVLRLSLARPSRCDPAISVSGCSQPGDDFGGKNFDARLPTITIEQYRSLVNHARAAGLQGSPSISRF